MSLYVKLSQVVAIEPVMQKPYDFADDSGQQRKGVTIASVITGLMTNGKITLIKLKGKSVAEVETKLKALSLVTGKPAEIPVLSASNVGGVLNCTA